MASKITNRAVVSNIERYANNMVNTGWKVDINDGLPYVAVENSMIDDSYFWQGEEASELLDSVPDNIDEVDWILYTVSTM